MFTPANLDPREQLIFDSADEWYATRFRGRGVYDKIGPFDSQLAAVKAIADFFRNEETYYPPPGTIWNRPFALYASSSAHGGSHVVVGCVYRDGAKRDSYHEFQERRKAKLKGVKSSRGGPNSDGPVKV